MSKDLMVSKMVEYILFNPDVSDMTRFFKENGWWHRRDRSVAWHNAVRLADTFSCRYIREDWYPIPKEDMIDFVNRVRDWEIKEVPFRKMWRNACELRYEQPGLPEL